MDDFETIAEGIVRVHTHRHGGIYLSPERRTAVPDFVLDATFGGLGHEGWFEEDCDCCWLHLIFQSEFEAFYAGRGKLDYAKVVESATRMLEHDNPALVSRLLLQMPAPAKPLTH